MSDKKQPGAFAGMLPNDCLPESRPDHQAEEWLDRRYRPDSEPWWWLILDFALLILFCAVAIGVPAYLYFSVLKHS